MLRAILINYESPTPTTWFYLSFLLAIAVFFKFSRLWSLRNLDLVALLLMTPGVLLVVQGNGLAGLIWLLVGSLFFLVRLLVDPLLARRPLLEPNLNVAGLTFLSASLLAFLMDEVVARDPPSAVGLQGARWAEHLLDRRELPAREIAAMTFGPANGVLHAVTLLPARALIAAVEPIEPGAEPHPEDREASAREAATRMLAIVAHLSVVMALVVFCQAHFGSAPTGVAAATLYLLLPYTAYQVDLVEHVVPVALMVWALVACRRPIVAGALLGLASGFAYFFVFLVPLWMSYLGRARIARFGVAYGATLLVLASSVVWTSSGAASAAEQMLALASWSHWQLGAPGQGAAIWSEGAAYQRVPVFVAFLTLTTALVLRGASGRAAVLLSGTAALALSAQFWYAQASGIYISWYLPPLLLTVFRPSRGEWSQKLSAVGGQQSAVSGQQSAKKPAAV
jgi:hypothetical protein